MRRSFLAAAALGAPLLISLVLIGCGRPKDEEDAGAGDGGGAAAAGPATAAELKPLPAKHGAVLRGKVTIKGAPDIAAENAELADEISKKPDQKPTCYDIAPEAEKTQQKWVLDGKGGVGNVVVWIQPPANTYFQVDPNDKTWPDRVELRQPHCASSRTSPGWCRRWWTPMTPPRRSRPARSSSCRTRRPCRTTRRGARRTAPTAPSWGRCRRARRRRRSC